MLEYFAEFMTTIDVYSLSDYTSDWGTTEKTYPATATKQITGYIQPVSGSMAYKNQSLGIESSHVMYTTDTVNDTDRVVYGGITYKVTYNQHAGISGISDHYEIGLIEV